MPISIPIKSNTDKGFTLVEVMVAVFILAIGLLGIAGLQVSGIKANHTAMIHTQSTQLIYDLSDRIRANMRAAKAGNYLATAAPAKTYNCFDDFSGTATPNRCNPKEMALSDLDWIVSLANNTLPFQSISITCISPGNVTVSADTAADDCPQGFTHSISITWNEHDGSNGLVNKTTTIEFQP